MDKFSEAQAVVNMLVDYVQVPDEDRAATSGGAQAGEALQLVTDALSASASKVMENFQVDPDTFGDVVVKHLLRQMSRDEGLADQLGDLLSKFHRERAAHRKMTKYGVQTAPSSSGLTIQKSSVVVEGDVKDVEIAKYDESNLPGS